MHKSGIPIDVIFAFTISSPSLCFLCLITLSPEEQVGDTLEVFLHDNTQTLSIKTVACEVTVVGLVVDVDGKITVGE